MGSQFISDLESFQLDTTNNLSANKFQVDSQAPSLVMSIPRRFEKYCMIILNLKLGEKGYINFI